MRERRETPGGIRVPRGRRVEFGRRPLTGMLRGATTAAFIALLLLASSAAWAGGEKVADGGGKGAATGAARPKPWAERTVGDLPGSVTATPESTGRSPDKTFLSRYLSALGWVAAVAALGLGALYLIRRFGPGAASGGSTRFLEVLARSSIAPKHQVVVVRVGERALVLGVSPDRIEKLGELNDPREIIRATPKRGFHDVLASREAEYEEENAPAPGRSDFVPEPYRREIDRLRTMVGNLRFTASRTESER